MDLGVVAFFCFPLTVLVTSDIIRREMDVSKDGVYHWLLISLLQRTSWRDHTESKPPYMILRLR
jgi:hypothetical protein